MRNKKSALCAHTAPHNIIFSLDKIHTKRAIITILQLDKYIQLFAHCPSLFLQLCRLAVCLIYTRISCVSSLEFQMIYRWMKSAARWWAVLVVLWRRLSTTVDTTKEWLKTQLMTTITAAWRQLNGNQCPTAFRLVRMKAKCPAHICGFCRWIEANATQFIGIQFCDWLCLRSCVTVDSDLPALMSHRNFKCAAAKLLLILAQNTNYT